MVVVWVRVGVEVVVGGSGSGGMSGCVWWWCEWVCVVGGCAVQCVSQCAGPALG